MNHWSTAFHILLQNYRYGGTGAPMAKLPGRPGVTKRCRLSWLTNSALLHEPKSGGGKLPVSSAVHRRPNKLWRSNSIFNPMPPGLDQPARAPATGPRWCRTPWCGRRPARPPGCGPGPPAISPAPARRRGPGSPPPRPSPSWLGLHLVLQPVQYNKNEKMTSHFSKTTSVSDLDSFATDPDPAF